MNRWRAPSSSGYIVGAVVMIVGGIIQATMGVEAAQRDLEDIAPPLSAQGEEIEEPGEEADRLTIGREEARQVDERGEERLTRGGDGPSVTSGTDEPHQPSQGR
jgi:hypothetical protein